MSNYAHNLFLLLVNLSQYKNKDLIIKVFVESLNTIFKPHTFEWCNEEIENCDNGLEVCTISRKYGHIKQTKTENISGEILQMLQNAVQMLAVILEKIDQEQLLTHQKAHLNHLVHEKTTELTRANDKLKNQLNDFENLTDKLKETNIQLEIAKNKAEEGDRLKTSFLHNMSHEIRTPLNAIMGFSELLNAPGISEENRHAYANIVNRSGEQLLSIVTDVLTIASIDTGQEKLNKEKVSINTLISEIKNVVNQQISEKPIVLKEVISLPEEEAEVFADRTKLYQVLSNLIFNAIKFTSRGEIEVGYTKKDAVLEFFVKDDGIGIDKNRQKSIFKRFVQADENISVQYGGTGLGLSICQGFVELMGGQIWVESEESEGATFFFTLPYEPIKKTRGKNEFSAKGKSASKLHKSRTILVVEDQHLNFLYLEALLKELNVNIIHAKNGHEAVNFCKENQAIDLVLMDLKMPGLDGENAASQIKEFRPELTIIAQTAYVDNIENETFKKVFDDYLTKPMAPKHLTTILNKYI